MICLLLHFSLYCINCCKIKLDIIKFFCYNLIFCLAFSYCSIMSFQVNLLYRVFEKRYFYSYAFCFNFCQKVQNLNFIYLFRNLENIREFELLKIISIINLFLLIIFQKVVKTFSSSV